MTNASISQLLKTIHVRERLPIWSLRLILGAILLVMSEVIMWQNPPSHTPLDWVWRAVQYFALAAIVIDVTVRFQARDIAGLVLVGGLYGLLSAGIISKDIYTNLPWTLLLRGMGLQTGAGLYGLLFFVLIMQGRDVDPRAIVGAVGIGLLWGVWIKWYPVQTITNWGPVTIESATLYLIAGFVLVGALVLGIGPRFGSFREPSLQLEWWEWIVVGTPLFISLIFGLLDEKVIPALPFGLVVLLVLIILGALILNRHGTDPSILANLTFAAPNAFSFVALSITCLVAGTIAATLTAGADSPLGVVAYLVIIAAGSIWLPAASALVGLRAYRRDE
jgi:hypothetical protein